MIPAAAQQHHKDTAKMLGQRHLVVTPAVGGNHWETELPWQALVCKKTSKALSVLQLHVLQGSKLGPTARELEGHQP
jgi:hypothetical protein